MGDLDGKTVLVTGAARGLGAAIVPTSVIIVLVRVPLWELPPSHPAGQVPEQATRPG